MGAPMGMRLIKREGRARGAMPLHMAKVRSDNRGPKGAADERARKPRSAAGEGRHRTKPLVPKVCPGGTNCAVETVDAGGGNEADPQEIQSGESHAISSCEQPERGSAHHSTRDWLPCAWVGPGATTRVMRSTATEDPRERVKERVQNGSTLRKVREGARDVGQDGLVPSRETVVASEQPQRTSRAHGARANRLNTETEEPGEYQDDKSTTCGRKRAGGNKEAQGSSNSNPSGQ